MFPQMPHISIRSRWILRLSGSYCLAGSSSPPEFGRHRRAARSCSGRRGMNYSMFMWRLPPFSSGQQCLIPPRRTLFLYFTCCSQLVSHYPPCTHISPSLTVPPLLPPSCPPPLLPSAVKCIYPRTLRTASYLHCLPSLPVRIESPGLNRCPVPISYMLPPVVYRPSCLYVRAQALARDTSSMHLSDLPPTDRFGWREVCDA